MPSENGRGLNNDEASSPAGPEPREPEPEDTVAATKSRAADGSLQDDQLMTQGDVLERDGCWVDEEGADESPDTEDDDHHGSRS